MFSKVEGWNKRYKGGGGLWPYRGVSIKVGFKPSAHYDLETEKVDKWILKKHCLP